jgi:hypothetical protein
LPLSERKPLADQRHGFRFGGDGAV